MSNLVRRAILDAELAQKDWCDHILVQNLQATVNSGVDVWHREKAQRAQISVKLRLAKPFMSAAFIDTLDESTIHYGKLSKEIQAQVQDEKLEWRNSASLVSHVVECIHQVASGVALSAIQVEVLYPKGSMFGDGATYSYGSIPNTGTTSQQLYLQNVRIPCIIGINPNERLQKQPVVVNLWIDCLPEGWSDMYSIVETELFEIISNRKDKTLERLSGFVMQELVRRLFTSEEHMRACLRLRIEKPLAVPSADAPAVELLRPARLYTNSE